MIAIAQNWRRFTRDLSLRGHLLPSLGAALALSLLVFLLEYAMDYIGFFNSRGQAIWWPTNGLALALMLRNDRSRWPMILAGVLIGSGIGTLLHGYPASSWAINAVANSLGPLLGALMLPHCRKLEDWLREPHLVLRFAGYALVLAPALSAAIFASNVHIFMSGLDFWQVFQTRADSDMLGYAMFTPLVLVIGDRESYRLVSRKETATAILLLGLVAATTWMVFAQSAYALSFVLVSVILLVCLRLGFAASVLAVNLLAVLATAATMHGRGPLVMGNGSVLDHRILLLQAFLGLMMVTAFSVSVVRIEREAFQAQLQRAYREMEELANTDTLTGLANRRRFEETLKLEWARALRSGDSLALLLIDVDHFKAYNDRFGHPAGDVCLRAVAQAMLAMDRRSTDLLARFGGEEFILLLPGAKLDGAVRIAEEIRACIEGLSERSATGVLSKLTASAGCVALAPRAGPLSSALIAAADEALYRAKGNGRNRVEVAEVPAGSLDARPVL